MLLTTVQLILFYDHFLLLCLAGFAVQSLLTNLCRRSCHKQTIPMDLTSVVKSLDSLASPKLAESWDNVGLLVEPSSPHPVKNVLLTNDLTQPVVDEAKRLACDMVISYHPPIFRPLKRLRQTDVKEKIIVQCVENRIAVYSPHTSFDAVENGVNDWLLDAFGKWTSGTYGLVRMVWCVWSGAYGLVRMVSHAW